LGGVPLEYLVSSFTTIWNITAWNQLVNFKIILLSIIIEAFPFLLLSVIISSLLNNFVSENTLRNIIPKDNLLSIIIACFLGLLFPVCDCGMVPIVRRLILKGVPLPAGIAFMLAAPIVNPVVGAATAFAFQNNSKVILLRLGVAFLVALCTGIIINIFFKGSELKSLNQIQSHTHGCCHHITANPGDHSLTTKLFNTIRDASNEFFEMGKYLFMGAMLGALSQIAVPRELLVALGQHSALSIGVMMLFAFFISVCSSADAFIAASFNTNFTVGSLVAFMVFGPMIDLKNILMLLHTFRIRFVACLTFIVIILCSSAAYIINNI
jgi:uncharacterized membrane protein YraQ (UPF0718 family)